MWSDPRKGEYIRDISQQILSGTLDLDLFRGYPDTESIINDMVKIRGVGRWTAGGPRFSGAYPGLDAFPADDVGVRLLIAQVYRKG